MTLTSAPRARVGATGRAVVLSPLGSRLALKRAPKGAGGVWCTRPGAPCGARSRCFPWCRARREIFVGVGDSHGPYEWPAPSRRAPRARTIRAWGVVVLVRPRGAPRGARRGCSDALTRGSRAPRGILACAGGSRTPRASPAPAQRAQRARAEAPRASKGLWCGARYDTAERDPHADGARACPDVRRRSTCY